MLHSSPLFTFGLRTELKRNLDLFGRGAETTFLMSHRFGFPFGRRFSIHRFTDFPGEEWVKSGEESSALFILPKQLLRKSLHHFGEE